VCSGRATASAASQKNRGIIFRLLFLFLLTLAQEKEELLTCALLLPFFFISFLFSRATSVPL
jgi:hypothetical protein